jgi:hypothetical protein
MSTIQTVIVEHYTDGYEFNDHAVFFLEEAPEVVKESIAFDDYDGHGVSIHRTVYSLKEYMELQSRPLMGFCPPAPKKGIWWLSVDIDDLMRQIGLVSYSIALATSGLTQAVKHHHVTLAFDVRHVDYPEIYMFNPETGGTPVFVKGLAYNDKCAALVVEVPASCCNKVAHITLATAEGIAPVYSNDMLAGVDGPYSFLPLEDELEGTLEFFQFQ